LYYFRYLDPPNYGPGQLLLLNTVLPEPTRVKVPKQRVSSKQAERKEGYAKAHAWHLDRMRDEERKRK